MWLRDRRLGFRVVLVLIPLLGFVGASCGGDDSGGDGKAGGPVEVTLQEWSILPSSDSASAGDVSFSVSNTGEDTHEFVIIRTDLDPGALPTAADGSVSEDGEGMEVVDEAEDIAPGATTGFTATLEAGKYVLICNIVEEADGEVHYANGMRTAFTVD